MKEIDLYFEALSEANYAYLLTVREFIKNYHDDISEEWKYSVPFFYFRKKPFCYLYKDKKTDQPYIGIPRANKIEHVALIKGDRKKMKILPLDNQTEIPYDLITEIFELLIPLYIGR